MSGSRTSPDGQRERTWKCGTPYKYPLPEVELDPWTQLLKPLQEKDAERCKVWKDEVSNILIFAGLFSAVVTAFIIESYKSLRKDPVEAMLEYLVANRIGVGSSGSAFPSTTDSFSLPENSSTRINTLWFLSLVLSLATVLIGTIALQWVREHERNHGELEPQIAFSLQRMQSESLDRWLVPHTFALLSLLLLAAVVLFLLGLVELLWLMNRTVGGWVGAVVALAFLFMALTTVLPTCQAILLFLPFRVGSPRTPCPYKSPQAWAFHHLCSPIVKLFANDFGEKFDKYSSIDSRNLTSDRGRADWMDTLPHGTGILFRNKDGDSWLEHGVAWLYQRDFDFMKADKAFDSKALFLSLPVPLYDTVQGLLEAKQTTFVTQETYTPVDHGLGIILTQNEASRGMAGPYGRFLHRLSLEGDLGYGVPPGVAADGDDILQDDATLRLFSRNIGMDNLPFGAEQRGLEVCIRLTDWLYGRDIPRPYQRPRDPEGYHPPQTLPIQWVVHILENRKLESTRVKQLQYQTRSILLKFFRRVRSVETVTAPLRSTMDTNEYLGRFLAAAGRILTSGTDNNLQVCDDILRILGIEGTTYYGFQAALIFCHAILIRAQDMPAPLGRLISCLHAYNADTGNLRHPLLSPPNFSWSQFLEMAKALGMDSLELDARDSGFYTPSEHSYAQDSTYSAIVVSGR